MALGDKGEPLRNNLLKKTKRLLSQEQHDLLLTHFKQGLQRHQSLPASQHSVLGNFFRGELRLISEQTDEQHSKNREIDPLHMAREELNYGNIDIAQQILEQALLGVNERERNP